MFLQFFLLSTVRLIYYQFMNQSHCQEEISFIFDEFRIGSFQPFEIKTNNSLHENGSMVKKRFEDKTRAESSDDLSL